MWNTTTSPSLLPLHLYLLSILCNAASSSPLSCWMRKSQVKAQEQGLSSLLPWHDVLARLSRPCCNRMPLCATLPGCCLMLSRTQMVLLSLQSHGGSCRLLQGSQAHVGILHALICCEVC